MYASYYKNTDMKYKLMDGGQLKEISQVIALQFIYTVWHKILTGEILTNFYQFINILPIKFSTDNLPPFVCQTTF